MSVGHSGDEFLEVHVVVASVDCYEFKALLADHGRPSSSLDPDRHLRGHFFAPEGAGDKH